MILPTNGKVVIIDDQPKDVIELIASLSKEKIPFVHFKEEDLSDLPDSPIENVRLVFLDLELTTPVYVPEKNITSPIKTRLQKIIRPQTAYALVIWSKKEDRYKKALVKDFDDEFKDYKPILQISLPKADIIGKAGAIDRIRKELENEMKNFESFNAFLFWESLINEVSGNLTNKLTSLYRIDDNWNARTKYLLYKLATAYGGKAIKDQEQINQLRNALYTLSMTLSDNIENAINEKLDKRFSNLIDSIPQDISHLGPMINKFLLISDNWDTSLQPGTLFFCIPELEHLIVKNKGDWDNRINTLESVAKEKRDTARLSINKRFSEIRMNIEKRISEKRKIQNAIINESLIEDLKKDTADKDKRNAILSSCIGLEVNVTPLCDYAQKKTELFRMLPGVMMKSKYRDYINNNSSFAYILDADFRYKEENYFLVFDFRYLYTINRRELSNRFVIYRLRQQLLSDIQVKLSSHVNRSGVLYVY